MDDETWMNAVKAVELGFADDILYRDSDKEDEKPEDDKTDGEPETKTEPDEEKEKTQSAKKENKTTNKAPEPMLFSQQKSDLDLIQKINKHFSLHSEKPKEPVKQGRSAAVLMERLNLMKY